MSFPVLLHLGPVAVHPHILFETLAYALGFRLYLWQRGHRGDHLGEQTRGWVIVAAVVGAALGSKVISWLSDPALAGERAQQLDAAFLIGGKSIAGALAAGLVAVELAKRRLGVRQATGDLFALPLAAGIAIGRIGCFLTGLDDHTHGLPTDLPWAVDFGDGVTRHPAQLYEVLFLVLLMLLLLRLQRRPLPLGDLFKVFMVTYFGFRLLLEGLKPGVPLLGLNAVQWVALCVLLYYGQLFAWRSVRRRRAAPPTEPTEPMPPMEVYARG